jgi:carboxyl-terminal processing protease
VRAARAAARHARAPRDTYPAIELALRMLGDPHSFFLPPAGAKRIASVPVQEPLPTVAMVGRRVAQISLPGLGTTAPSAADHYVQAAVVALNNVAARRPCGWILDLRSDSGGNMWPMLTTVAPLLRSARAVGYFVDSAGRRTPWIVHSGAAYLGNRQMTIRNPINLGPPAPVAVLVSPYTASAGEAVAIAFLHRPDTRMFGEPTAGVPTGNDVYALSDGASLVLTGAFDADRTGHVCPGQARIQPDEQVEQAPPFGHDRSQDWQVATALRWLHHNANACPR